MELDNATHGWQRVQSNVTQEGTVCGGDVKPVRVGVIRHEPHEGKSRDNADHVQEYVPACRHGVADFGRKQVGVSRDTSDTLPPRTATVSTYTGHF